MQKRVRYTGQTQRLLSARRPGPLQYIHGHAQYMTLHFAIRAPSTPSPWGRYPNDTDTSLPDTTRFPSRYNTMPYNSIRYNTRQDKTYNTTPYLTIPYLNTIRYNTIQGSTIQRKMLQCSTIHCNAMRYNRSQYSKIQYNTIQ